MKAKTGKIWFSDLLAATIVRKTTNRTLGKMQTSFAFALGLHYLWHQIQSERK